MASTLKKISSHVTAALVGAATTFYAIQNQEQIFSILSNQGVKMGDNANKKKGDERIIVQGASKDGHSRHVEENSIPSLPQYPSNAKKSSLIVQSPITIFNPNPNLEIAFDARTKNPTYVMERFPPHVDFKPNNKVKRNNKNFYEEKSLPEWHRSRNGYFRMSGYDRGHMAAAANYKYDDGQMHDTFSLINVSPQTPVMNRIVWSRLENLVRSMMKLRGKNETWHIVSGPIWLPGSIVKDVETKDRREVFQYSYLGIGNPPGLVQVPTHFFKVVFATNPQGKVIKFAAFVIPNDFFREKGSESDGEKIVNLEHDFLVRLTDVEAVTGISFFPEEQFEFGNFHEVLDLITEKMWIDISRQSDNGAVQGNVHIGRDDDGAKLSQSRIAAMRKKLRAMERKGIETLPKHLCEDGSCNMSIKIKKLIS